MTVIIVSLTCHEEENTIFQQCENLVQAFKSVKIVIHVNKDNDDVYTRLIEIMKSGKFADNNIVYINPYRVSTEKKSFNLHLAHKSNLDFIKHNKIDFDYFVMEASNSLFVRKGVESYISQYNVGLGFASITGYWKERVLNHKSIFDFYKLKTGFEYDKVMKGCHEGSFFSKDFVHEVFNYINELENYCNDKQDAPFYPTEEIWFQIIIKIMLKKRGEFKIGNTVTHLPWERNLEWSKEQVQLALSGTGVPKNKFAIKRIDRDPNDPLRKLISSSFN